MVKIGVILPTTSRGRTWEKPEYSYLYKFFQSFKKTLSKEHTYVFYVAYDYDDAFYLAHIPVFQTFGFEIRFVASHEEKGWVTRLWNMLAKMAYEDGCEYIFQCGDDIFFHAKGWVQACIDTLRAVGNVGLTGPRTMENAVILTQAFVHRTHLDIFGYFFPEEIKNWYCDDWINAIYPKTWLKSKYTCGNVGGKERYTIAREGKLFLLQFAQRDKEKVMAYMASKKIETSPAVVG
jgi:hypothetical protein